jgi:hypothetical protein
MCPAWALLIRIFVSVLVIVPSFPCSASASADATRALAPVLAAAHVLSVRSRGAKVFVDDTRKLLVQCSIVVFVEVVKVIFILVLV